MEDYSLLVVACPRQLLTASDLACVHHFVAAGGCLLVLAEAGGDAASGAGTTSHQFVSLRTSSMLPWLPMLGRS
jgi:hypothetical protein